MKDVLLIYFFVCLCSIVLGSSEEDVDDSIYAENRIDDSDSDDNDKGRSDSEVPTPKCWMSINATEHFKILDDIDARYANVRKQVQESLKENDFDNAMIDGFIRSRGVAIRELNTHNYQDFMIPSGLNLGGFCMLRMPESLLFFHRMKLRNNTYFRVNFLYNDLSNMVVTINLSLNDLHLKGAFERSLTERDPSVLIYAPTYGLVEFLLKDVKYRIEGRYRLINNRLRIELINSQILVDDILMTYLNQAIESSAIRVKDKNLGSFLSRMKKDLDKWIKDYFNDYIIDTDLDGIPEIKELAKYDKEKGTALEEFTDKSIHAIATRIRLFNAESISLPSITFNSIQGLVVYRYEAAIPTGVPPLTGTLTLTANELTAHLALTMIPNPDSVDLDIEILDQMKPESLTVEGAANVMIATFKHLLEHQVMTTMSSTLIHAIEMFKTLPRCVPFLPGQIKDKKGPVQHKFFDLEDSESEEMLRGKTDPQRRSSKYPNSRMKQSNRSVMKKNQKELNKYKGKSKKVITINKT